MLSGRHERASFQRPGSRAADSRRGRARSSGRDVCDATRKIRAACTKQLGRARPRLRSASASFGTAWRRFAQYPGAICARSSDGSLPLSQLRDPGGTIRDVLDPARKDQNGGYFLGVRRKGGGPSRISLARSGIRAGQGRRALLRYSSLAAWWLATPHAERIGSCASFQRCLFHSFSSLTQCCSLFSSGRSRRSPPPMPPNQAYMDPSRKPAGEAHR
jgi:hypothetical protein